MGSPLPGCSCCCAFSFLYPLAVGKDISVSRRRTQCISVFGGIFTISSFLQQTRLRVHRPVILIQLDTTQQVFQPCFHVTLRGTCKQMLSSGGADDGELIRILLRPFSTPGAFTKSTHRCRPSQRSSHFCGRAARL